MYVCLLVCMLEYAKALKQSPFIDAFSLPSFCPTIIFLQTTHCTTTRHFQLISWRIVGWL